MTRTRVAPVIVAIAVGMLGASVDFSTALQAHETHSGSGDGVVRLSKPDPELPALLVIRGNAAGRHFAVVGHTASRERTGALVNTTERYFGIVPVDLPPTRKTAILEVSAEGPWEIQVYPIGAAEKLEVPGN